MMLSKKFRKLEVDLPVQPLVNQRPFMIAGILLALAILVGSLFAYFDFPFK